MRTWSWCVNFRHFVERCNIMRVLARDAPHSAVMLLQVYSSSACPSVCLWHWCTLIIQFEFSDNNYENYMRSLRYRVAKNGGPICSVATTRLSCYIVAPCSHLNHHFWQVHRARALVLTTAAIIQGGPKMAQFLLNALTLSNISLTDFQNSFTVRIRRKFVITLN